MLCQCLPLILIFLGALVIHWIILGFWFTIASIYHLVVLFMSDAEIDSSESKKVVKGMATYFNDVKMTPLGASEADFLMINTPPVCNYRCKKCFTAAGERRTKDPLSLDEWRRIISEGKDLGVKNVSILGEGEPLIHKDIKDIIARTHREGIIPMIATNAMELNPAMTDFLYDHDCTVGFSFDTLDGDEYNEFCRGNADFAEVMKNIAYARKRFAQAIQTENGFRVHRLLLHTTVTPQNYHWFRQIRDFCGDDIYFDAQPLANVGVAEKHGDDFGQEESYEQFQRTGHVSYPPMVLSKTQEGRNVCCLFNYGLAVNHSGDIMFDTHAIEPERFIGNVRDVPLAELLKRTKQLRQYFLSNFPSAGYCPVRDDVYKEFVASLRDKVIQFI